MKRKYEAIIEAYLFLVGDKGININAMSKILDISVGTITKTLINLSNTFKKDHHGLEIIINDLNNIKMIVKRTLHIDLKKIIKERMPKKLSTQAIEVILIIAYSIEDNKNVGCTLKKINKIRNVNSYGALRTLLDQNLIYYKKIEKKRVYKVSPIFFDYFKIKNLKNMPNLNHDIEKLF